MHAPVSTCDLDTFKHFQTRQAAWNIERRHLQLQMERLRQEKLAKAKAKKADTAAKAKKLASDWERKDALVNQHAVVQNAIGASEQGARHEERRLREMEEKLKRENEVAAHLANREAMEALSAANDAEIVRCGAEAWSRGMQVGAEECAELILEPSLISLPPGRLTQSCMTVPGRHSCTRANRVRKGTESGSA